MSRATKHNFCYQNTNIHIYQFLKCVPNQNWLLIPSDHEKVRKQIN